MVLLSGGVGERARVVRLLARIIHEVARMAKQ